MQSNPINDLTAAYTRGRAAAIRDFSKVASAKDVVQAAELLGTLIGRGGSTVAQAGNALVDKATNARLLAGLMRDSPRGGLVVGTGLAGAGLAAATLGDLSSHPELFQKVLGPIGMLSGTALAVGANPGLIGGNALGRISREIAAEGSSPVGLLGITAGLVGLPAALIGYGRMKERSESSFF